MKYKDLLIYFMSGTGNTYRVACWSVEQARQEGVSVEIIPVEKAEPKSQVQDRNDFILGIYMPTHGFTAPWLIIKSTIRLPRVKKAGAFVVSTRAGLKLGRVFTPGISGSACFVIALILFIKGYAVRGVRSVDMPSNWISIHPGLSVKSTEAIKDRNRPLVLEMVTRILSGKTNWFTINNLYEIIWAVLLSLISVGYLLAGRIYLPKYFFANNKCNGCAICANSCPVGAIKMIGRKNPRPFWQYYCESCMRCMNYCPLRAVEAGQSWAALTLYFLGPFVALALWLLIRAWPALEHADLSWVPSTLGWLIYYPVMAGAYIVFIRLLRIRLINHLFTYTTLTHFWKRYHEPETSLKAITKDENKS